MRGRLLKIVLFCCAIFLCSCSKENKEKNIENYVDNNAENAEPQNTIDPVVSAIEYENPYYENRVAILKCKMNYEADVEEVKALESDVLSFDSCQFHSIDKLKAVMELQIKNQDITPDESLGTIKKWLKSLNIDDIDTDKEIRDASGQYESDEGKKSPYDLPAVADHYPDFKTGNGFLINTNRCHIQMGAGGVYSMSDGTITKYLGSKSHASSDAFYEVEEKIVAEGKVSELADKSWKLLSGKMSVQKAADLTKHYFDQGAFLPCAENVTVDVPEVKVFRLKDKYGYLFMVRRMYQKIPFAYSLPYYGNIYSNKNSVYGDDKKAYVVNDQTVSAFAGYSESEEITPIGEPQDYIISIKEAVSILEKNLIPGGIIDIDDMVDVGEAGFVYCPCQYTDNKGYAYPCWEFRGTLGSSQDGLNLYVNALNGEIYTYGCRKES